MLESVAWAPDGTIVVAASADGRATIWDVTNGILVETLGGSDDWLISTSWAADGRLVALGSKFGVVKIWEMSSSMKGRCILTLDHGGCISSVLWATEGRQLASASANGSVKIWDAATGIYIRTLNHSDKVFSVAWGVHDQFVACASDETVKIGEVKTGIGVHTLDHNGLASSVAWDNNSQLLASGSDDGVVYIWDILTGKCTQTLKSHDSDVFTHSWGMDGWHVASGSEDRTIKIWQVTDTYIQPLHKAKVASVAWAANDLLFASGSWDRTVKVWDAITGEYWRTLPHGDSILSAAWAKDGRLVSGLENGMIQLCDVAIGKPVRNGRIHASNINSIAWSADDGLLASASWDFKVKIWDTDIIGMSTDT
ncbi:het-E [Fusarium pseudoanthophilum]|uniref:Het-E n=1 Tax=Fusarium pseudoanthophilum TaxID=48495 RepID=A0A8H5K541_9HYPO|nr:het-E [Fusarium pseudoanthophilum]